MPSLQTFLIVYLGAVVLLSLTSFVFYGYDKRQAALGGRRVPEATLHWLALFGGIPGAIAGQQVFRHKTQKLSFRIVFWLVVVVHLACVAGIVVTLARSN
jgi:uncharacterized membrane protein YsdA (DUF1294 family)